MYSPTNSCSLIVHILLKYPILALVLGISAAANFVNPMVHDTESSRFQVEIKVLESKLSLAAMGEAEKMFEAILKVMHSDGVSYGPAGLTRPVLKDVCKRLQVCSLEEKTLDKILNSPRESVKYAKLYFYDMVHRFGSVEIAVIAYNAGPTKVASMIREGKKLPQSYLKDRKSVV